MSKTVKVESSMIVLNAAQTTESRQIIKETVTVNQATQTFPQTIAANQVDVPVPFGGITQGKRVLLSTSQEVTLKINNITDQGFPWSGTGYLPSNTGITGLWVTTGANETDVTAVITGN